MIEASETRDASVLRVGAIASGASSGEVAAAGAPQTTFQPGDVIGARYRVLRFLARGGMGEVYEAEDLELDLRVAVKTIRAERIGEQGSLIRLKREILAARRVSHPNVVRLHDVGFHVLPDLRELAFITMDLLAGETLEEYLRKHAPLAPEQARPILLQLAAALDAAHAADVVHRDFKSQNVIVMPAGAGEHAPRAVITDFGLAEAGADLEGSSTATVEFVGTPAYMAPEQVSRLHPVTRAADIYALGIVMFEMVTGARPFVGLTALATAARRLEVPPPSPRERVPGLPVAWDRTILRCLARDPAQRFASAGEAVAALDRPPRRLHQLPRFVALALMLIVAGAGVLATRGQAREQLPLAAILACPAPVAGEIFVDAGAAAGGSGGRACPLRTITHALALPGEHKLIHVARGTYDRQLGEDFPLVVRGDVRLIGAGIDRTAIVGSGRYDTAPGGGTLGDQSVLVATLAVGDRHAQVSISDLGLAPSVQDGTSVGVVCTRGNLSGFDGPIAASNTLLRSVTIGPGYSTGVIVATETEPEASGCNLRLEDARVLGGQVGVWALGCGGGQGRVATSLEVIASSFAGMHDSMPLSGAGVVIWDCTRRVLVQRSLFERSDRGIAVVRHANAEPGTLQLVGNTLRSLERAGIALDRAVRVERLADNEFIHVKAPEARDTPAPALELRGVGGEFPSLVARNNTFLQGDLAVSFEGDAPPGAATTLDFGRPDDPGGNRFVCNSRGVDAPLPGGDVAVSLPGLGATHLHLHGNMWDHAPPTVHALPKNGLDVRAAAALWPQIDLGGAARTRSACNLGVAGP